MTTTDRKTVECEVRSLIDRSQYEKLKAFFSNVADFVSEGSQETRYFEGPHDLRIQRGGSYAKVWLKKGSVLDGSLQEVDIRLDSETFPKLEKLFEALGYKTAVVWQRYRLSFAWDDVAVALDHTEGYGYVVEMRLSCDEASRGQTNERLRERLAMLGLRPTPKPVLHERFSHYRERWKEAASEETKKTPA